MNSLDDSLNAMVEHTIAAISMTGEIFRYGDFGNDHAKDIEMSHTRSSSTDESRRRYVRSVKQKSWRPKYDDESLPYDDCLLSFFFQEENVLGERRKKHVRGRSLYRRKTRGMPTNAARPSPIHNCEPETIEVVSQKAGKAIHRDLMKPIHSSEPEKIEKHLIESPDIYEPDVRIPHIHRHQMKKPEKSSWHHAIPRIRHFWSQKRVDDQRRHPVNLIESVDTFDMLEELAEMKQRRTP